MQNSLVKSEFQDELVNAQHLSLGELVEQVSGASVCGRDARFHEVTGISKFRISRHRNDMVFVLSNGDVVAFKAEVIGNVKGAKK